MHSPTTNPLGSSLSFRTLAVCTIVCSIFSRCTNDQFFSTETAVSETYPDPVALVTTSKASPASCSSCNYVVPDNVNTIDGSVLRFQPGWVVCLNAARNYGTQPLRFINVTGTAENPIYITNCGGTAKVTVANTLHYAIKFENSKFFRVTGGDVTGTYGIKLSGAKTMGISVEKLSTNFEIDHVEISNIGFAGIMAKSDPGCDNLAIRGAFTMRDSQIHHNYIHDTGGEGLYIGNSFYANGMTTSCGVKYPHDIVNMKVYSNVVKNTAWEGIQVGCAVLGAEIHSNLVENAGTANVAGQNNGIQIGEGTGGRCYNNFVKTVKGNGIIVLGLGDNTVFNNIIVNVGQAGIFCDDRATTGTGFKFFNNSIANPGTDGIKIYADKVGLLNIVKNNFISNPGNYAVYENDNTWRTGQDSFLFLLSSNVKVSSSNNYYDLHTTLANYLQYNNLGYILNICPVKNKGCDVASYGVTFDFKLKPRPYNGGFEIGALEY
jgi:hypothetical protein